MHIKALRVLMVAILMVAALSLFANGKSETENVSTKLTMMINFSADSPVSGVLDEVVSEFNESQSDIFVELVPPVGDYEQVMKTKMATNDLLFIE